MSEDRITRTYAVWDRFVSDCAREGLTVDPHAMTLVLLRTVAQGQRPTRWEHVATVAAS
jgi:hypothetical protein